MAIPRPNPCVPCPCHLIGLLWNCGNRRVATNEIHKPTSITSRACITSLNSHFPHQKPQHRMLRRKKAEPKTPHLLSWNQDIVAWSQKQKCGLKYVIHITDWPVWTWGNNYCTKHWNYADMISICGVFLNIRNSTYLAIIWSWPGLKVWIAYLKISRVQMVIRM